MFRATSILTLITAMVAGSIAFGQVPRPKAGEPSNANEDAAGVAFFEKRIRPVLVKECYSCHSQEEAKKIRGGLVLDTRAGIQKGGDSGPVIVAGNPSKSSLIKALHHKDPNLAMPPKKKLDESIIRDFEEWVRMGAPDPRQGGVKATHKYVDFEKARNHWSYVPPKKATPPKVKSADWPLSDVDRFVLATLEKKGLTPAQDADRRTWIRRVSLDLIGLPPTPAEVESFVADPSPEVYAKAVDRLLDSPRFGEKWARHWLDVARYAESTGKTVNFNYPHAWRYRDYVIAAFNGDKPYDQFIKEQIAGDLMSSNDPVVRAERLIATGFLAIGPKSLNERSGLKFELDLVDEQIDVTTQAFLGITVACARCHDHKFDPFSQRDYYAMAGIFRSTETCYGTVRFINAQRPSPLVPLPKDANPTVGVPKQTASERRRVEGQIKTIRESVRTMKDPIQQFFSNGQVSLLQARLDGFDEDGNPKLLAMGVRDKPARAPFVFGKGKFGGFAGFSNDATRSIEDSPIYIRGEPEQPGDTRVPRGAVQILANTPLRIPARTSGRLELATWIASKENPLTARVMVNRVWLQLFGRGLAPSSDDFGLAGRPPTHPELLDHLALQFMSDGWSVKRLIKDLVLSRTYRIDSVANAKAMSIDPDNALLWRMAPRRLDAEILRDSMLAVSDQLDAAPPKGSVVARAGEGPVGRPRFGGDAVASAINDPKNVHRSIFLPIIRDNLPEVLSLFDGADPTLITTDRPTTTVPSQSLFLLNNPFVLRNADAAASKLLRGADTESEQIQAAYLRYFSRPPSVKEQSAAEAFLQRYRAELAKDGTSSLRQERESWSAFCQALFASAEFQYRR